MEDELEQICDRLRGHCNALSPIGFTALPKRWVEAAGMAYEVNTILDGLLLGRPLGAALSVAAAVRLRAGQLQRAADEAAADDSRIAELMDADDAAYRRFLRGLDPLACKQQDHYRVLGLSRLRHAATQAQIRSAYRLKALDHHPDKRQDESAKQAGEDYYSCITRAFEQLSDSRRRRAFDSVDPTVDDSTPSAPFDDFFQAYGAVFERNARWSNIQPVPLLGAPTECREVVEDFYSFWFNFDSWREYSYLDEEDKERAENREERRWMDRQNKAARDKLRKDELKRIRNLVEAAYDADPRVAAFKQAAVQAKAAAKEAKRRAARERREAIETAQQDAAAAATRQEEEERAAERAKADERRRQADAARKLSKARRDRFHDICEQGAYFAESANARLSKMEGVDRVCETLPSDELDALNARLSSMDKTSAAALFDETLRRVDERLHERATELAGKSKAKTGEQPAKSSAVWTAAETQLLVKAATLFPVGTKSRWEVIATFINEHAESAGAKPKSAKDVIAKAKEIQSKESAGGEKASVEQQFVVTSKKRAQEMTAEAEPTQRVDDDAARPQWTAEQQRLFEQALRTFGPSAPDRWDRVAECVPAKSKRDCIRRFKELAELVRTKKVAQEKVKEKVLQAKENRP